MAFDWLSEKWDEIVVQGGVLEKSPTSAHYLLSGIWVRLGCDWFEVTAVEMDGDFHVACYKCNNAPVPESNKFYKPERKIVMQFPRNCPLDSFMSQGLVAVDAEVLSKEVDGFVFDKNMELRGNSNHRIIIRASEAIPGSIEIYK